MTKRERFGTICSFVVLTACVISVLTLWIMFWVYEPWLGFASTVVLFAIAGAVWGLKESTPSTGAQTINNPPATNAEIPKELFNEE